MLDRFRKSATVITTILTPAPSRDLITTAIFVDDWAIADPSAERFIARAITRCSRTAERFCNRSFGFETVQDEISLPHDGWPHVVARETQALQLSRWPVVAVESVTVDGVSLAQGVDFSVVADIGQMVRLDAAGRPRDWLGIKTTVVYSCGYWLPSFDGSPPDGVDTLPDQIVDAVGRMVYTRYAERQRDPLVKSEYVDGVSRVEYLAPSVDGNLSPDVQDILDDFRVPVVG